MFIINSHIYTYIALFGRDDVSDFQWIFIDFDAFGARVVMEDPGGGGLVGAAPPRK